VVVSPGVVVVVPGVVVDVLPVAVWLPEEPDDDPLVPLDPVPVP
jgi:hypothetical protein